MIILKESVSRRRALREGASSEDQMTSSEVAGILRKAKRSTNKWAVRDTLMRIGNSVLGTDYVSLDPETAISVVDDLLREVSYMSQDDLWRIYDELGSSV